MSHLGPVFPEEQRHLPVTGSHRASSAQSHSLAQPGPKVPCSHTEQDIQSKEESDTNSQSSCCQSGLISSDLTDLCGSGFRSIPEDRCSGPTQGGRTLRSYSHTAAGTAGRGDQEDRLRTRESGNKMFTMFSLDFHFDSSKVHTLVQRYISASLFRPSLCMSACANVRNLGIKT